MTHAPRRHTNLRDVRCRLLPAEYAALVVRNSQPGVDTVSKTIRSMRLVGARNFIVLSTFSALYGNLRNLFISDIFKKSLSAPAET
jgi:hypothetical protein